MIAATLEPQLENVLRAFGPEGALVLRHSTLLPAGKKRIQYMFTEAERISAKIEHALAFKETAVGIRTFIEDPYYLNMPKVFYPKVLEELEELNSGRYVEAVLTGGIGTGKTTCAIATTAYQLYLLSLYRRPHEVFGIAPTDEIIIVFQSINAKLAKSVDYNRFRQMMERSPYFNEKFQFDKNIESELRFPNRIIVKPISGQDTGAIGQNVIGGILDEVNFMAVTENSKQSHDGGTYDQAWQNYQAIVRRRESRFMKQGKVPGMLCLVSSKRYPGEFTEIKAKEARSNPTIFVYDKRVWDIKPADTFSGSWFNVFIGTPTKKPRILEDGEKVQPHERHLVISVPTDFLPAFNRDLLGSLRDIAGVSTLALHPFITDIESVVKCFNRTTSILSRPDCNFKNTSVEVYPKRFKHLDKDRFVHIDLAISGDSAGVACGYVDGFKKIYRGEDSFEILPNIVYDFILEVEPPKNDEIQFHKIRELLYKLRQIGLPIKWVSLDTFQSTDTLQLLRQQGFMTGVQSMDTDTKAYDVLKTALLDNRVVAPEHEVAYKEIVHLERDAKKNKVDHPPKGCLCKDTKVACMDGVPRTMEELTADYARGVQHVGLSWDIANCKAEPRLLEKPHITKYVTELVEVEMENGEVFICTPDHPYLLVSGGYIAAGLLREGDDLQS